MRERILCLLNERRADLKTEWAARLRVQPVRNAMAEPAILGYLMDETIGQLADQLTRQSLRRARSDGGVFEDRCRCGLNPLLVYFATGETALAAVMEKEAPLDEPLREFVNAQWRLLAQRELDALCGACVRKCPSPYPKLTSDLTPRARVDAGGRGTRLGPLLRSAGIRG